MSFNDIFKSSFLESMADFSVTDVILAMLVATILALYIYVIYKKTTVSVMYSNNFALTLVGLSLVTTLVIIAVTSNVVLSLGMVGALSIVRFRSAIKEPMEIVFLFWSLAVGIVTGAGLIPLAIIGSLIIGLILVIFANKKVVDKPYILVLNCDSDNSENALIRKLKEDKIAHVLKTKVITNGNIELTYQVKLKNSTGEMVNNLASIPGINNVSLISYNGEYMN